LVKLLLMAESRYLLRISSTIPHLKWPHPQKRKKE
jgi:hypothetical protein